MKFHSDPFKDVDELEASDVWSDVEMRVANPTSVEGPVPPLASPGHRVATAAVALLVFVAGFALLVRAVSTDSPGPLDGEQIPPPDAWASFDPGLNKIAPLPSPRFGSAKVWTGSELLIWGGATDFEAAGMDDGFSFAPADGQWEDLPASPLRGRLYPLAVWSGSEMIVLGGMGEPGSFLDDGAAYDPATRSWREIPQSPIRLTRAVGVWANGEVVVWTPEDNSTAAFDPATDSWRILEEAPYPLERVSSAVWTGSEMIVVGELAEGAHEDLSARALAYDVLGAEWIELPDSQLREAATNIVWSGTQVLGVDYAHLLQSYTPGEDSWHTESEIPLGSGEGWPSAVAIAGSDLFVDTVSGQTIWHTNSREWTSLPELRGTDGWTEPVAAGNAIVIIQAFPVDDAEETWVWKVVGSD